MRDIILYEHHGVNVWADKQLKGTHREICLCYSCSRFVIGSPDGNCPIANKLFELCVENHVVTPVLECPKFTNVVLGDDAYG